MQITIVGTGYVGLVTGAVFAHQGHQVTCVDNDPRKLETLEAGRMPIYEPGLETLVHDGKQAGRLRFTDQLAASVAQSELVFICVGTPPLASGKADLSMIEVVARDTARALSGYTVIVEKSTVPVQTGLKVKRVMEREAPDGAQFDVASNPEFLREGSAVRDALNPDRIVVGVDSPKAKEVLERLYKPFGAPIIVTDIESAEIIKHAANSFLAVKISYINAVANICELAGANVDQVALGMGLDKRIGRAFLSAGIGYGGSCFPKDVDAFYDIAAELGYKFEMIKEAQRINSEQRTRFIKKIEDTLWVVKDKRIGVLGLSFKPDTDDLREAPALDVLAWLLSHGAQVRAYDPQANEKARELFGDVEYVTDPYAAAQDADALLLLTEWDEFKALDLARIHAAMHQPILLDARNLYDPEELRAIGFEYASIGRP